jgi:hypothetical protein
MSLAFYGLHGLEDGARRSGDRRNRNRCAHEQAGEDDSADEGESGVLDLGDEHGGYSLIVRPDHPALMPKAIAGGVPISISGGFPRFLRHAHLGATAIIADYWRNLRGLGKKRVEIL